MEQKTAETLKSLAVTTINSIRQPVASLSGGQRQSVAVAKAVQWNSKLVILDEPTAALGVAQTEQVLALVRRLAEQGLAVVIISHNLHDIFETADRITVLRLGRTVGIFERAKTTQQEVVEAITAGVPTKVSGIPQTRRGELVSATEADVVGQNPVAPPRAGADRHRRRSTGAASTTSGPATSASSRSSSGSSSSSSSSASRRRTSSRRTTSTTSSSRWRDDDARLRRRLRPPARRDRPLDQLRRRDRRHHGRRAPAARQRPRGQRAARDGRSRSWCAR